MAQVDESTQGGNAEVTLATVAGLLHDLGAFWYRTGERVPPELAAGGGSTTPATVHAHWSAAFVMRHLPLDCQDEVAAAVRDHHQPQDRLSRLVSVAARLAAGGLAPVAERGDIQLQSVLGSVFAPTPSVSEDDGSTAGGQGRRGLPRFFVPLHPLAPSRPALFPGEVRLLPREAAAACARLWHGFLDDHATVPLTSTRSYADSLWWLLWKYTWCLPSVATGPSRDTSLFDHLRLTAAVAAALALAATSDDELQTLLTALVDDGGTLPAEAGEAWRAPRFQLVGVDVSGWDTLGRSLRGTNLDIMRAAAFSLAVLRQAVVAWLRQRWDLPQASVLFEGGGRAYLLAPGGAAEDLPAVRSDLTCRLWQAQHGEVAVTLASVPVRAADLCPAHLDAAAPLSGEPRPHLGRLWAALNAALAAEGRRVWAALGRDIWQADMFAVRGKGGTVPTCRVCDAELPTNAASGRGDAICARCQQLREMGQRLRRPGFLVLAPIPDAAALGLVAPPPAGADTPAEASGASGSADDAPGPVPERWDAALQALDMRADVLAATDDPPDEQAARLLLHLPPRGPATVLRLNHLAAWWAELQQLARPDRPLAVGWQFIPALSNGPPSGGRLDTRILAAGSRGAKSVAYLRVDLDDIEVLLAEGLGDDVSPARLATLSSLLRVFCDLWLLERAAAANAAGGAGGRWRPHICAMASGSNGLGVVGAWDTVVELGQQLAHDFARYGCRNPVVHLSAGIALAHPRVSYSRGDGTALANLAQAKARSLAGPGAPGVMAKNSVDFLNRTLGWPAFAVAARYRREIVQSSRTTGRDGRTRTGQPRGERPQTADRPELLPTLLALCTQVMAGTAALPVAAALPADGAGSGQDGAAGALQTGRWSWVAAQELTRAAEQLPVELARRVLTYRDLLLDPREVGLPALTVATLWAALLLGVSPVPQEVA